MSTSCSRRSRLSVPCSTPWRTSSTPLRGTGSSAHRSGLLERHHTGHCGCRFPLARGAGSPGGTGMGRALRHRTDRRRQHDERAGRGVDDPRAASCASRAGTAATCCRIRAWACRAATSATSRSKSPDGDAFHLRRAASGRDPDASVLSRQVSGPAPHALAPSTSGAAVGRTERMHPREQNRTARAPRRCQA